MDAAIESPSRPVANCSERLSLRLWLQLMKCTKTLEAVVGSRLRREYNQSLARFDVFSQLYRLGGDWVSIGEVAGNVMAASHNITALLDRMVAEGLIERRASPDDRRSHQVRMTAEGRSLFDGMANDHLRWVNEALDGFDQDSKRALISLLVEMRDIFGANALGAHQEKTE